MIGGVTRAAASGSESRRSRCADRIDRTLAPGDHQLTVVARFRAASPEQPGHRLADDDLARLGSCLGVHRHRRVRTTDDQLPVSVADQEEMERTGVGTDRDLELQLADRRRDLARPSELAAHLDRGRRRLTGVVRSGEQQQQCVAAELQELPAPLCGDPEHPAEDPAQRLDQLLGADPAPRGEFLREGGEARDVGEHHRALDDPPASFRLVGDPVEDDSSARAGRDVRSSCPRCWLARLCPLRRRVGDARSASGANRLAHVETSLCRPGRHRRSAMACARGAVNPRPGLDVPCQRWSRSRIRPPEGRVQGRLLGPVGSQRCPREGGCEVERPVRDVDRD